MCKYFLLFTRRMMLSVFTPLARNNTEQSHINFKESLPLPQKKHYTHLVEFRQTLSTFCLKYLFKERKRGKKVDISVKFFYNKGMKAHFFLIPCGEAEIEESAVCIDFIPERF